MPNSIEILQNTLLQLIVRQGTDSTRRNVVLKSGELGYTTDTKKLYVGDGATLGGSLVGKTYAGSVTNITTLSPASNGDLAYDTDNNKLYRLSVNDGSNIGDWELIGGVYSANDTTLTFSIDNKVAVGTISGSNISPNALSNPIHLNGSNQIALSAKVTIDEIVPRTGDSVKLPNKIQIGSNTFTFSNESYGNGDVFYIDGGEVKTGSLVNTNNIFTGNILVTGTSELSGGYKIGRRTVAQLPSAGGNNGLMFEVTDIDGNLTAEGGLAIGGGSDNYIVRSNDADWIVQRFVYV
jgi:Major tropism determinant N-terminal domain